MQRSYQKPKETPGVRPGKRECLRCQRPFHSKGIHNRTCPTCKRRRKLVFMEEMTAPITDRFTHISDLPLIPVHPKT